MLYKSPENPHFYGALLKLSQPQRQDVVVVVVVVVVHNLETKWGPRVVVDAQHTVRQHRTTKRYNTQLVGQATLLHSCSTLERML